MEAAPGSQGTPAGADTGEPPITLEILHRDEHLVAVNKPSGMIVHRGAANDEVVAMKVVRDMLGQWVYPVHRLDRGTSGVLVLALSSVVAGLANRLFEAREVDKRYLALVRGIPPEIGVIDHPIPNKEDGPRVEARTDYRVLGAFERFALVEARPWTGRMHQIRRHFKHISHPLVGDVRYGKGDINRDFRARFGLHRLALHAASLRMAHPAGEGTLEAVAPLPPDLAEPLAAMGLLAAAEASRTP
jgi:tRNA pseudouridine65 synthase